MEIKTIERKMTYKYSMYERLSIAKKASKDIEGWLRSRKETIDDINVEDEEKYRKAALHPLTVLSKAQGILHCFQYR